MLQDILQEIEDKIDASDHLFTEKKYKEYATELEAAWTLLPEPKVEFDVSYQLALYLCDTYILLSNSEQARKWANILKTCDLQRIDDGEREFISGKVSFMQGNFVEAKQYFEIADQKSDGHVFEGENPEYLKLLKGKT